MHVFKMCCSCALNSYFWFLLTFRALFLPTWWTHILQDPLTFHPVISPRCAVGLGYCWAKILHEYIRLCDLSPLTTAVTDKLGFRLETVLCVYAFLFSASLQSSVSQVSSLSETFLFFTSFPLTQGTIGESSGSPFSTLVQILAFYKQSFKDSC